MKKALGFLGRAGLLAALLLLLALALFALRTPAPAGKQASKQESGYPPPGQTQTPVIVITVEPTQPAPTFLPTIPLLTPHPPAGWPTDEPWPPVLMTSTPTAPEKFPDFPTPELVEVSKSAPETELQGLWYPYYRSPGSRPLLHKVLLDQNGSRKIQPEAEVDVNLSPIFPGPSLSAIQLSLDGEYLALDVAYGEGMQVYFLNLKTQALLDISKAPPFFQFFAWVPGSLQTIVQLVGSDPNVISRVELISGEHHDLVFPALDGIWPNIYAFSYAPTGEWLADGVVYPLANDKENKSRLEIGLWDSNLKSREALCQINKGDVIFPSSLQWSTDGAYLMWISGHMSGEYASIEDEIWLWVANAQKKECQKVRRMGTASDYLPGLFTASWRPGTHEIALIALNQGLEEKAETSSIYLYDLSSGKERLVREAPGRPFSHVSLSPEGDLVVYNLNQGEYGELWITNIANGDSYPIAGPTLAFGPYLWLK